LAQFHLVEWLSLNESLFGNVKLFSNFLAKVEIARQNGINQLKFSAQGAQALANETNIFLSYKQRLRTIVFKIQSC
jgi:hypothetical protein